MLRARYAAFHATVRKFGELRLVASRSASRTLSEPRSPPDAPRVQCRQTKPRPIAGVELHDIHAFRSTWRTVNSGSSSAGRCESGTMPACCRAIHNIKRVEEDAPRHIGRSGGQRGNSPGSGMTRCSSASREYAARSARETAPAGRAASIGPGSTSFAPGAAGGGGGGMDSRHGRVALPVDRSPMATAWADRLEERMKEPVGMVGEDKQMEGKEGMEWNGMETKNGN